MDHETFDRFVRALALAKFSGSVSLQIQASFTQLVTNLSPGTHTFTARYRGNGGDRAEFSRRQIAVVPLPWRATPVHWADPAERRTPR